MVLSEKLTHFFGQNQNNTMFTTKRHVVCYKTTRRFEKVTRRISNCKSCRNIRQRTIPREKEEDARIRSFAKKRCCKNKFCNTSLFRLNRNISANEELRMSSKSPQQGWQEVQNQSDLKCRHGLARHFRYL